MRSQLSILGEWFVFSIFMFTLPFISYFGSKHLLQTGYPELVQDNLFLSTLLPVVAAVLTVWTVIAVYAYIAWRDEFRDRELIKKENEEKKKD